MKILREENTKNILPHIIFYLLTLERISKENKKSFLKSSFEIKLGRCNRFSIYILFLSICSFYIYILLYCNY